jgi:hypothetical protein
VLLPLLVTLLLFAVGTAIVAKVAGLAMRRLGLELESVLVWLGIAEAHDEHGRSAALALASQGERVVRLR